MTPAIYLYLDRLNHWIRGAATNDRWKSRVLQLSSPTASLIKASRSGAPRSGEPGTHDHDAGGYGFRVRVLRTRPGMTPQKLVTQ